jgi:molecular chaperone DnaK
MAGSLLKFYETRGWRYLQSALQRIVGRSSEYSVEEPLFRKEVVDPAWQALPERHRSLGRRTLRWDEVLLAIRREVYTIQSGKLILRKDARERALAVLGRLLQPGGGDAATGTAAKMIPVSGRVAPPPTPSLPPPRKVAPAVTLPVAATPVAQTAPRPRPPGKKTMLIPNVTIGMDLGTTYSVVAHLDAHGRPTSIPNAAGDLLTPSVVLFDAEGVIIGKEAVAAAALEPDKVADGVKRDLGAKLYHRKVNGWELPPEAIAAFILKSLKGDAERKLGPLRKAVLTVPAYFDETRRRSILTAGQLVDLEVLDIVNEPIAAALAYSYEKGLLDRRRSGQRPTRLMVFLLGGGMFDVTLVEVEGLALKAIATDGDLNLGGKDWDDALAGIAAADIARQTGTDPRKDPATFYELRQAAESAKRMLTERTKAAIVVNHAGWRLKVDVSRQEFEHATAPLLARTRTITENVLKQAKLSWSGIDTVLLVGGATRMPMVANMLLEMTGRPPERSISPDEAVAHGAALYADMLQRRQSSGGPGAFSVTNVNAHSLGILGIDGQTGHRRNQILIPKNTPLPCTVTMTFKTSRPNQRRVTVHVVEGESENPKECMAVGTCAISNLPKGLPAGWPVHVNYTYEENGQLYVQAQIEGHASVVTTTFQRDHSMDDKAATEWNLYVAKEWQRRNA